MDQPRNPISRKQVELILSRSVSGFALLFGAQTLPVTLSQIHGAATWWIWVGVVPLYASLLAVVVTAFTNHAVRITHGIVSAVYVLTLVTWPFAHTDTHIPNNGNPWLYYLVTVATATAVIAFSRVGAAVYLFIVPTLYGVVHSLPPAGGALWLQSVLDAVYGIILGGSIVVIGTMLRQASSSVDIAQDTALVRYAHAVRQHATEVERVQVDAIVHDSVLTTLLSAARAYSPEAKALAATMASNAIGHLSNAARTSPDDPSLVRVSEVARRISDAAATMSAPIAARTRALGTASIPVGAAEAVYSAAVQSMVNSLQHAGDRPGVRRWVRVVGTPDGGIEVEVGDNGDGFDMSLIPTERIGLRVSIIERLTNAGGSATVVSAFGKGTVITMQWPSARVPPQGDVGDAELEPNLRELP